MTLKLDNSIGKNFCYAPWTNIHIDTRGIYKTCCAGKAELGDLRVVPIQNIMNSSELVEIKSKILNNQEHPNCKHVLRKSKTLQLVKEAGTMILPNIAL